MGYTVGGVCSEPRLTGTGGRLRPRGGVGSPSQIGVLYAQAVSSCETGAREANQVLNLVRKKQGYQINY